MDDVKSLSFQALLLVIAAVVSRLIYALLMRLLLRMKNASWGTFINYLLPNIRTPTRWLFFWCAIEITLPFLIIPADWALRIHHILYAFIIGSIGWILTGITLAGSQWLDKRYSWNGEEDNLRNRSINTRLRVFSHVIVFVIWLITSIIIIMTIPHLRSIGVSLFASAGVAGIVIGMAAGPTLSNLIAGIQLALTQPIRIGDQIVIENVSGIVEEIDSTYVVVRLWDLRRLIVPLNYFIQNRFQNWTHTTSDSIIAQVVFYVDYTLPINPIRSQLETLVHQLHYWDGKVCRLQVTAIKDNKMVELQASVSTRSATHLYPLQCEIREQLLSFIQQQVTKAS